MRAWFCANSLFVFSCSADSLDKAAFTSSSVLVINMEKILKTFQITLYFTVKIAYQLTSKNVQKNYRTKR